MAENLHGWQEMLLNSSAILGPRRGHAGVNSVMRASERIKFFPSPFRSLTGEKEIAFSLTLGKLIIFIGPKLFIVQ